MTPAAPPPAARDYRQAIVVLLLFLWPPFLWAAPPINAPLLIQLRPDLFR